MIRPRQVSSGRCFDLQSPLSPAQSNRSLPLEGPAWTRCNCAVWLRAPWRQVKKDTSILGVECRRATFTSRRRMRGVRGEDEERVQKGASARARCRGVARCGVRMTACNQTNTSPDRNFMRRPTPIVVVRTHHVAVEPSSKLTEAGWIPPRTSTSPRSREDPKLVDEARVVTTSIPLHQCVMRRDIARSPLVTSPPPQNLHGETPKSTTAQRRRVLYGPILRGSKHRRDAVLSTRCAITDTASHRSGNDY